MKKSVLGLKESRLGSRGRKEEVLFGRIVFVCEREAIVRVLRNKKGKEPVSVSKLGLWEIHGLEFQELRLTSYDHTKFRKKYQPWLEAFDKRFESTFHRKREDLYLLLSKSKPHLEVPECSSIMYIPLLKFPHMSSKRKTNNYYIRKMDFAYGVLAKS
ncbi:hypothetical protein Tco_0438012 [Tanacetum coccineum]